MAGQQHQSDSRILDRRNLWTDHRRLAALLSPAISVLDVGCGTGAITKDIADAVGPDGVVVGVDRDRRLIDRARVHCASRPHLRFEEGDATCLPYDSRFDIVTAARALQWIADPMAALGCMKRAAKPGGVLVVLDYNHTRNEWEPTPPAQFVAFYSTFLTWRASNGWDNEMADHCPALFEQLGLKEIRTTDENQTTVNSDADFAERAALWSEVIDNLGPTLQNAGVCDASLLEAARHSYDAWRRTDLVRQTLSMKTTVGRVPAGRILHAIT